MATGIYARISDDRQDGAGVARQLEDCHALADRQDWSDLREFVDNDFSASRYAAHKRPAYAAMLEAIRAGEVDRVVVWHVDRLYRQPRELEDIIDLADRGQAQVVSVHSGDLNLSNSDGIAMARILVAFAAKSSDDTSRRVKRAKQQARDKGLPNGGRRAFGWSDTMTPNPREALLINQAMTDLLQGVALADMARRWSAAGVLAPQSGRPVWTADTVRQVVSNPRHAALIGHRVQTGPGKFARPVVVGPATWPAIVTREKWDALQALLFERGASNRVPRRRSLLTGLLVCASCGGPMVRTGPRLVPDVKAKHRSSWRCSTLKGCGKVSISAGPLEAFLTEATLHRLDTAGLSAIVRQQGRAGKAGERLTDQLGALEGRLRSAADAFATGTLSPAAYEAATGAIERQHDDLQRRLARQTSTGMVEPYVGRPGALRAKWPTLTDDQRRSIIAIALGKVRIAPVLKRAPTFDPSRVEIASTVR